MFAKLKDRDFTLKNVRLSYLAYWTIGAVFVGMVIAPDRQVGTMTAGFSDMDELAADHDMSEMRMDVPLENAPTIELEVSQDAGSGWNVFVQTTNFLFVPENVRGALVANEGHGHVYLNGEKLQRLYGPYFHIDPQEPGTHQLTVTLNAHNHAVFSVNGEVVQATAELVQPDQAVSQ
ncbi:MAG: hypothetical protein AAFR98_00370 [Pseudomonadota bacterium]